MSLLGRQTVIAKCPACQATTKVSVHPDKPSIRCPRCQASVPLIHARKYTEEKPETEPEKRSLRQDLSSHDYGSELPIPSGSPSSQTSAKRRQKRYVSETGTNFSYPDHSVNFVRYAIIATVVVTVLALVGVCYLFWKESINSRNLEYFSNVKDSLEQYQRAIAQLKKWFDPLEGAEVQKSFPEVKGKIDFLAGRRRHMTVPDDNVEGFKEITADLVKAEKELSVLEEDIKRFATQAVPKPQRPEQESVAANLAWSMTKGPPPSPSQVNTATRKVADDQSVIINLPGLSQSEWNDDFARRFSLLADNGEGKVVIHWAGDLLTLEVRPVIDPARYAAKINFGKLLYYSRNERIITMEFKPEKVNNYKAQGDSITPILLELKQRDKAPKILSALTQLGNLKVDPGRQAEVAVVVETIAVDTTLDPTLRNMAIKLVPNWSGRESANLLIRLMDDKSAAVRLSAIDALVETRSPLAAQALVKKWDKLEVDRISRALIALGSDAESAVLPFLNNNNSIALRTEACRVLHEIGTNESLKPLLDLMNAKDQSPILVDEAKNAMRHILERKTK